LFKKLIDLIKYFQEKEFVRFLEASCVNTLIGYCVTMFLFYMGIDYRLAQIMSFGCFPISYTTQTLFAFRAKWSWRRMLIFPLSSLPNLAAQVAASMLSVEVFHIPEAYGILISYVVALPLVFLLMKFLVKGRKKQTANEINTN
jgi:putative flippase GtrA